jgi:hypothetical protein
MNSYPIPEHMQILLQALGKNRVLGKDTFVLRNAVSRSDGIPDVYIFPPADYVVSQRYPFLSIVTAGSHDLLQIMLNRPSGIGIDVKIKSARFNNIIDSFELVERFEDLPDWAINSII